MELLPAGFESIFSRMEHRCTTAHDAEQAPHFQSFALISSEHNTAQHGTEYEYKPAPKPAPDWVNSAVLAGRKRLKIHNIGRKSDQCPKDRR
jgi:hypothetical protein